MKSISLIIPCYNEEAVIRKVYSEIKLLKIDGYEINILFIDDGSTDHTLNIIEELCTIDEYVDFLSFSRNFGKEAAMYAGFCNCTGDYIAIMDADMQDPPSLIPEMIKIIENSDYDSVATRRSNRIGPQVPAATRENP